MRLTAQLAGAEPGGRGGEPFRSGARLPLQVKFATGSGAPPLFGTRQWENPGADGVDDALPSAEQLDDDGDVVYMSCRAVGSADEVRRPAPSPPCSAASALRSLTHSPRACCRSLRATTGLSPIQTARGHVTAPTQVRASCAAPAATAAASTATSGGQREGAACVVRVYCCSGRPRGLPGGALPMRAGPGWAPRGGAGWRRARALLPAGDGGPSLARAAGAGGGCGAGTVAGAAGRHGWSTGPEVGSHVSRRGSTGGRGPLGNA